MVIEAPAILRKPSGYTTEGQGVLQCIIIAAIGKYFGGQKEKKKKTYLHP